MPYTNNQGIRIHYKTEGVGPPLVLQHGFTDSLESWYEMGYVDALKNDYRLIVVDARGHGGSDKPHDPAAYSHECHVADLVDVLDDLSIPTTHFLGYSMGGRIGFALATYASERFSSLLIGGANPYQRNREQFDERLQALRRGPESIVALWDGVVSPALQARLLANDGEALVASWMGRMRGPGLEDVTFVSLPDLRHSETFFRSDLVLPHVLKFLASVSP